MNPIDQAIATIDAASGGYGFSQGYGLADPRQAKGGGNATNYSINPEIQRNTAGASTLQISVSAARTSTGSGNTYNPIYLFGGNAFSGTSRGYNCVQINATLTTAVTVTNNKNVVTFKYEKADDNTKYTTYTVTLATAGDYVFVLNGTNRYQSAGMQVSLGDTSQDSQLTTPMQTFELDDFGKAVSNDLTTVEDLYQQKTGLFVKTPFYLSRREGLTVNVLDVDGFSVSYYMWLRKVGVVS